MAGPANAAAVFPQIPASWTLVPAPELSSSCEVGMCKLEPGECDVDMFFLPANLQLVGSISKYWNSTSRPPLKVYSGRPGYLQLFSQPMGCFVPVPEGKHAQGFKEELCAALYTCGVEIPLPTSHPMSNWYNGTCVALGGIKVHWEAASKALQCLGVDQVYLGQFGCKVPLPRFCDDFKLVLEGEMHVVCAFDVWWHHKDTECIWLLAL